MFQGTINQYDWHIENNKQYKGEKRGLNTPSGSQNVSKFENKGQDKKDKKAKTTKQKSKLEPNSKPDEAKQVAQKPKYKPKNKSKSKKKQGMKIVKAIMNEIIDESLRNISVRLSTQFNNTNNTNVTDQDRQEYPKIEVSDILDNESNPEVVPSDQIHINDDTTSCKSSALPADTGLLKSSNIEPPKNRLNTKAKVFTRSTEKEDDSCISGSAYSMKVSPVNKLFSKSKEPKIFLPRNLADSRSEDTSEQSQGEVKGLSHLEYPANVQEIRLSSKSMQNTKCHNSPFKAEEKKKPKFSNKSKAFTPTYMKEQYNQPGGVGLQKQSSWQQVYTPEMGYNNMFEMNCFQLFNERLAAFTGNKFPQAMYSQNPYFGNQNIYQTPTKSKSVPTNVPMSDMSYSGMGYQMPYEHSDTSENYTDPYIEDNAFYEKFDEQIYKFVAEVESRLNSVAKERAILAKKTILKICKTAFKDSPVRVDVFGSLATGLALEGSDMDLVVTGLKIEDRDDVVSHIRILQKHFTDCEYFFNIKPIESASIPVIKLEADLEKVREKENPKNTDKIDPKMRYLQIDITFDDSKEPKTDCFWEGIEWHRSKLHLGMKSIHLVKTYIKEYVHLKELTLCIKKLLSAKGLNSPYQGGLSSYGVVIMIVAYMNFFSLQNAWVNISQLLIHFFDFYGSKFDESKVGILVSRGGCYYPFNSLSDWPIVIKDPLNIENNIGKNTYRITDIKSQFVEAARILEGEKAKFSKCTPVELKEWENSLKFLNSDKPTDKLMFLNQIFVSNELIE